MDREAWAGWEASRPTKDHVVAAACVAPWVSIEFDPSGWVYACCTSGLYPLGRIGEDRLRDLWGGPRAQVLKDALAAYDLSVACGPCRWHLEHGRLDPVAAVYDQYPVASPDPEHPYMMLFALSNRCNLGCVMCNPELSSTLRHQAGLAPLAPRYDDQFFEDLEPLLGQLRLAKFLGGEPFLAPEHKRVWDLMDRLDDPPRMQVTTNGTVWTPYVSWLMERFEVDISISIDAMTAPTYQAIRRGGDHAELLANVDRFADVCRRRSTELHVSYCLLEQNALELGAFLAWAERFEVPASINLVTDDGLALHDLDLAGLEAVRDAWIDEERTLLPLLVKNLAVWQTQRTQLDAVIAERRAGVAPAPRQSKPADASLFEVGDAPPEGPWLARRQLRREAHGRVQVERDRLSAWAGSGTVAELRVNRSGRIDQVVHVHRDLGLDQRIAGRPLGDIVEVMATYQGRPAWIVEFDQSPDRTVRTLALATERPLRGASGALVRTIQLPAPWGWTLLAAEDRIYDADQAPIARTTATPVRIGRRPQP